MSERNVQSDTRREQQSGSSRSLQHRSLFAGRGNEPYLPSFDSYPSSPFSFMRRFADNMERAFTGNWENDPGREAAWMPAIDVAERDNQVIVRADLPGTSPNDVRVEVLDDALVIQGERRQEHEENQGGYRRLERRYGSFYRAIPLPEGAQAEQARAEFRDGVLQVSIPVAASQRRGREIPIQTSTAGDRKDALSQQETAQARTYRAG